MTEALRHLTSKKIHWHEERPYRDWDGLILQISVFDHYLSEEEAETPLMSYRLARESGAEAQYLDGEKRWLSFYRHLYRQGAIIGGVDDLRLVHLHPESGRLQRLVIDSLRERRLMNVIFIAEPVRVLGGYDRTDCLLPPTIAVREELKMLAGEHGLFALN